MAKGAGRTKAIILAIVFAMPLAASGCAILFVRIVLGFQFPVPWPDETGFVAPAFDFAQSGSFFDPGLNPDRIVMWMPPGYMILLAAVFRLFGYSFAIARWVSAISCLVALGCCAALAWTSALGWRRVVASWVIAAAFLSPFMLIDANIARMEMVFAAIMLLAIAAAWRDRLILAAALIGADGLVHFNAVYFVPPLVAAGMIAALRGRFAAPKAADWLAAAAAMIAWLAYAVYAAAQWGGFREDMAFQFALKRFISVNDAAHPWWPVLAGAVLAMGVAVWRRLDRASMTGLFGAGFLVMAHNGHELWYDYGQPLGFACIALAVLAERGPLTRLGVAASGVAVACSLVLVVVTDTRITESLRPLLPHRAMMHRGVVPVADIAKVGAFIGTLSPGTTVNFGWSGMELFFLGDLARSGAHWSIIRHSVTQVLPLRKTDWQVVCDSSEFPAFLFRFDAGHPRKGADTGCQIIRP